MRRSYFLLFTVHCLLFTVMLWGCGSLGSDPVTAPPDSTITISPSSMTVTCLCETPCDAAWHTQFFTIFVADSDGTPLGNVKITISYPWAFPDPSWSVQLYDDSTPVRSPFDAETDDFGVYNLRFDYKLCGLLEYFGDLEVRSGSAYASASFEVTTNEVE